MRGMQRRAFLSLTGASLPLAAVARTGALPRGGPAPTTTARMKLGCQSGPTDETRLQFFARHGVTHICAELPGPETREAYSVDELSAVRDLAARYDIVVDMISLPFLKSSHIDQTKRPAIMLGQSPERDRDIEQVQTAIRNSAKAGIPSIKYNMSLLGVLRTGRTPGRGNTRLSTWRLSEASELAKKETRAGRVPADLYWERITYFLERVMPVAAELKVRMACHPHDPGVPPGFQGVDAVLGTVDGLKRFITIAENPYHGLNFCQGTVSEMLQDPGREIFDVIRFFGTRRKIFNVHFRNIRGHRDSFQEVHPDSGDIDFVKAVRVYKEVGYEHMLMPDHVPQHTDDPDGLQAFAFAYGYIRGLIQSA
jgi:mannonate dehydratase